MVDVPRDTSYRTDERNERFTYDLLEFREYNTFFSTPEDEVIGLEFLLSEPSCNDGLVEPFLGQSSACSQKCFVTRNKRDHISNGTKSLARACRLEEQHHGEDNYVHVQGPDEGILQEMNNLPSLCEDYIFDCKLAGGVSILDCDSSDILHVSQASCDNGKENNASRGNYYKGSAEMVNGSMIIYHNLAPEAGRVCQSSAKPSNKEIKPEVVSQGKEPPQCTVVNDRSVRWEDIYAFTQKRLRKRPQRYIDEYSMYHSVHTSKRSGGLFKTAQTKSFPGDCMDEDVRVKKRVHYNEYITEAIQVPFGPLMLKECSKEKASLLPDPELGDCNKVIIEFSEESTNTEPCSGPSQDDRADDYDEGEVTKDKFGRKHNKYWSAFEIAKLIEGVARYGVGRWTEIKKGVFPPTTRRTSVDLKDKWRNLLKACRAQLHSKNEGRRVAHQQVTQSVLQQVKELALMYPYPKVHNTKNALLVGS